MNGGSNLRIIVANRAKVSLNVIAGGFGAITGCANYERFEVITRICEKRVNRRNAT
jgi:hypothetical protein